MVEPGVVDGLVTELLQPDRHDPTCPFKTHCYCDDGAPHDAVQHPLARKAADTLLALKAEVEELRGALKFYARENNYRSSSMYMCGHSGETTISIDSGKKARAILSGESVK